MCTEASSAYFFADTGRKSFSFSVRSRMYRAGLPPQISPLGIVFPGVSRDPAASMLPRLMTQPSMIVAPMPTKLKSSNVQLGPTKKARGVVSSLTLQAPGEGRMGEGDGGSAVKLTHAARPCDPQ